MELTPKQIVRELDRYIIGQDEAKRAVAVALRNRYRRSQLPQEIRDEIVPKNILMVGPTGVGKTEIARRLAKLVDAPFVKVEATKFTEVGYVGRDVESIIRDLVEASVRICKAKASEKVKARATVLAEEQIVDLMRVNDQVEAIFDKINDMLATKDFSDLDLVLEMRDKLFDTIVEAIKSQLRRINDVPSGSTRAGVLYLTILNETKTMMLQSRNLLKSQQYFLEAKK